MGLHLNYELRLPAATSASRVSELLDALHSFATTLPFERMTPVATLTADGMPAPGARWTSGHWLAFIVLLIAEPIDEEVRPYTPEPLTAQGFLVNPGEGSETATFGFVRRHDVTGAPHEWYWQAFCKTQYASVVSNEHLVRCHTSLVALLDRAIQLGIDVDVHDETFYWETRDLIDEVQKMNGLVAALAGRIADAGHRVEAPIFEHREFEHLEMEQRQP